MGGFATVYRAVETSSGALVALKILRQEYAEDPAFLDRFAREARTAINLPPHPNLARTYDVVQAGGTYCLVMEYLDGHDLSRDLEQGARLPVHHAIGIITQVTRGLRVAHRLGVWHRDIKPENIRLTSAGAVKLMDFGIARAQQGSRLTQTGQFLGTPEYLPPEVWDGEDADGRGDVYALGVVLYQMLAGCVPYSGTSTAGIMRAHLAGGARPLEEYRRDLPPGLSRLVTRALHPDPHQRLQNADQFLVALQNPNQMEPVRDPAPRQNHARGGSGLATPPRLLVYGTERPLRAGATVIGRLSGVDIQLADGRVSGQHARLESWNGQVILRDMGSRNGTYVNGQPVRGALVLHGGEQIQVGGEMMTYLPPDAGLRTSRTRESGSYLVATPREHIVAAAAHGSVALTLASWWLPLLVASAPLALWLLFARSSSYVGGQARQAFVVSLVIAGLYLLRFQIRAIDEVVLLLAWLVASGLSAFMAMLCLQGGRPRYPMVGALVHA